MAIKARVKKKGANKATGRDYSKAKIYNKKTVRQRSLRNKARRQKLKELTARFGESRAKAMMKGKDVDHIKSIKSGGGNGSKNLRLVSRKKNRSRNNN